MFYKVLLVPPFVMQCAFIDDARRIGHSGEKRTADLLRERVWFPGMTKLAKHVVKRCLVEMTYDRTYDEPVVVVGYCKSTSFDNVKPVLDSMFATFGEVRIVKTNNGPPFHGHKFREYAEKMRD